MSKFKAGDKVVRTTFYRGYENGFMTKGGVYEVTGYDSEGLMLTVEGSQGLYNDEVFQLVEASDPQFKNMKFRVNSPEHSKEIQEALFEMGYVWKSGKTYVQFENDTGFFVTNENGKFSMYDEKYNINGVVPDYQEYEVETTKSYKLIPVESPKETVTIDGKTYDKEAVLKRLEAF